MTAPVVLDLRGAVLTLGTVAPVAAHLAEGGIIAYPTETVYGFGGLCSPDAVERVRALKRREGDRPLLVLIPGMAAAEALRWTEEARSLASIFWPGALTLVLEDPHCTFPEGVRTQDGTVAVRVSPHPFVSVLLQLVDAPLTSTSANAPGEAPAQTGSGALEAAVRLGSGREMLVVDAGTLPPSGPSTIVDCTGPEPRVLREGTLPLSRLRCAIPGIHGS